MEVPGRTEVQRVRSQRRRHPGIEPGSVHQPVSDKLAAYQLGQGRHIHVLSLAYLASRDRIPVYEPAPWSPTRNYFTSVSTRWPFQKLSLARYH